MRKEIFVALFMTMLVGACIGPSDDASLGNVVGDQEALFDTSPAPTTPPPYNKVKDDPGFEAVIDSYEMAGDDLKITFHHDAPSPQPIRVEGDLLDYELDLDTLGPGEEGALTIFEYRGQKFELHVGAESEVFSFGNVEVDHDETFGAGTVYRNTDTNETTLVVDGTKWNYRGEDGRWRRVKTAIKANTSREGYDYSSEQGQYKAFFKSDLSGGQSIRYENENGYATMQPVELTWRAYPIDESAKKVRVKEEPIGKAADSQVLGEAAADRFTYRDVFRSGIDLEYRYQPERLKEILVIPDRGTLPQPTIFDAENEDVFLMYHEVMRIPKDARIFVETGYRREDEGQDDDDETEFEQDGVDEVFRTSEPIIIRNARGEEILTIPEPLAWDSDGDEVIFAHSLERKNRKVYLHSEVPLVWLNDENTTYPVYIDANLVVSGTTNTLWGTKTYTDVYVINGGRIRIADWDGVWPIPGSGQEPKGSLSITATGTFTIDSTSWIDGTSSGYRGGSGGGYLGTVYDGEGNGYGKKDSRHPGWGGAGGKVMVGQQGRSTGGAGGVIYGSNTDLTFYMGSGGGGGGSNSVGDDWLGGGTGGDGGGALYLQAHTFYMEPNAKIDLSGGRGSYGGSYGGAGGAGSGGTLIIKADDLIISEAKIISAGNGGHQWDCNPRGCYPKLDNACGSGGRIKLFYENSISETDTELRTWDNQHSVSNPQYFGTNGQHACNHKLNDPPDKYTVVWTGNVYKQAGVNAKHNLYVPTGETYELEGIKVFDECTIDGTLIVSDYEGASGGTLDLTCNDFLTISATGKIDGQGTGQQGGQPVSAGTGGNGNGLGLGTGGTFGAGGGGAGYEGSGGIGGKAVAEWGTDGANNYDAQLDTCPMGSGGGAGGGSTSNVGGAGGNGGACIKLTAPTATIDGFIDASGHPGGNGYAEAPQGGGGGGAGSGGTINIHADSLTLGPTAKLYAKGYSGGYGGMSGTGNPGGWGGAGAGGRILATYVTLTQDPLADIKASPDGSTWIAPENQPPEAQNIQVDGKSAEPDISHLTNHNPPVSWTFYDADAGDSQSAYEVEVWTGSGGTGTHLFDTGKLSSQGTTVNLVGLGFVDGQTYYVRIRLWDSSDMGSSWAEKAFKFNTPPTTPANCGIDEGINDAEIGQLLGVDANLDGKHFITWGAASDPGDSITYEYWVRTTPTSGYYFGPLSVVGGTQSATGFPVTDGQELIVYVRASDGYESSAECSIGFIENSLPIPQTPTVDGLAAILDGLVSGVADPTPMFTWAYSDPEGHTQKSYQVKVATSQAFTNILWNSGVLTGSDTSVEYPAVAPPLTTGTGYWTSLQVYDGHEWSNPIYFGFELNNLPPAPTITSPTGRLTGNSHALTWTSVVDPDGDAVRYYWQVTDTPGNYSSPYLVAWGETANLQGLAFGTVDGQQYGARMRSCDPYDCGDWSAEVIFLENTRPTPPTPTFTGIKIGNSQKVAWDFSTDAEGDTITGYDWEVSTVSGNFSILLASGNTFGLEGTTFATIDGAEYFYRVRAFDGYEYSNWSEASFTENSMPTVPVGLIEGVVLDYTQAITWEASTDAETSIDRYEWQVMEGTDVFNPPYFSEGSTASLSSEQLTIADGKDYYYRLRACDGLECSAWSVPVMFVKNQPPSIPTGTLVGILTGNSQSLIWSASIDPELDPVHYEWQVEDTAIFAEPHIANGTSTTVTGDAFPTRDGQQYYYRVRACDIYSCSDWSIVKVFTENSVPTAPAIEPAFTGIVTGNNHYLDWGASTDAEGLVTIYEYQISISETFDILVCEGLESSHIATAGCPTIDGQTYHYRVRAGDGLEWGPWAVSSFTENTPPPIPTQVSPLDGSFLGILTTALEVAPVIDAESSQVEYRFYLDAVNGTTLYSSSTSPTLTISNLTAGKTYFWRVAAHDGYEEGLPSPVWALTTDIVTPTLLGSSTEPYNASTYLFKSRWEDLGSGVESAWLVLGAQAYQAARDGAEYVATLSGLSSGIYTYTWHARDGAGNEQASPAYQFEVLEYSNFTIRASDLLVQPGEQITLTGRVQRSDGFYPALVDIYDGQSFVTTSSVSQIDGSFSALLTLGLGTHSIRATVSDVNGITGESNTIDAITVKGLSINITITDNVVMPGEPFTITGAARYSDGTYPPQADLYVDNQFVRKINVSAPGSISEAYMINAVGMHNVRVELTDADGIRGSDSAMVNVKSLSIDAGLSAASILHFESSQLSGYAYYSDGSHPGTVDIHVNGGLHATVNVYEFGFYSYTISGLGVGDYTITVKHRDADGISGASSPLTLSVGDNPPTQNTQIVIENTSTSANGTLVVHDDQPTLTWTGGTDPDGDVVYTQITVSAIGPGGAEVLNASTAQSNYTLPKLDFQKAYYVRMQTYSGTGVVSEPYDFVIETANSPPGEPGPFSPTKTRNPSPTLTWIVGVDPDGDAVNTLITVQGTATVEASGSSYQLPELQLGAYTIAMQSEDPFGAVSATIEGTLEILPTNISLVQPAGGEQLSATAVLKTDVSGDVDRVIYYYSQDNGVTWVQIGQSLSQESPYTILWDTTKAANGPAVVKVTMIDLYKRTYEDFSEEVYVQNKAPGGAKYSRVFGDGTGAYEGGEEGASPVVAVLFFIVIMGAIASALSALIEYVKLPGHLSIGGKLERMGKENIYILAFLGVIAVVLDIGYGVFNAGILIMMFQDIVLLTVVGILVAGLWYFRGKKPPIPAMQHRPDFLKD